jgi:hypothetical protein
MLYPWHACDVQEAAAAMAGAIKAKEEAQKASSGAANK